MFLGSSILKIMSLILTILDASGNPVTETVQSVAVTDASGNPVTGIDNLDLLLRGKRDFLRR